MLAADGTGRAPGYQRVVVAAVDRALARKATSVTALPKRCVASSSAKKCTKRSRRMPPTAQLVAWAALAAFSCAGGAAGADTTALAQLGLDPVLQQFLGSLVVDLEQAEERTAGELRQVKEELERMGGRLDRCEAEAAAASGQEAAVMAGSEKESVFPEEEGDQMQKPESGREENKAVPQPHADKKDMFMFNKDTLIPPPFTAFRRDSAGARHSRCLSIMVSHCLSSAQTASDIPSRHHPRAST